MALNPEISLGVRPPQIAPLAIQTPLDRYQKMLTLRHLMTQGQLGALNLEQTRLENEALTRKAQGEQALTDLLRTTPDTTPQQMQAAGGVYASPVIKSYLEAKTAGMTQKLKQLEGLGSYAGSVIGKPQLFGPTIMRAVSDGFLDPETGRELIKGGYNEEELKAFQLRALDGAQQIRAQLDAAKQEAELPSIKAKSFKDRINQLVTIGAAKLARSNATKVDEYTPWVAGLSDEEKPIFQDVTDPLILQKRAQSPHEYVTAEQQEAHDVRMAQLTQAGHTQTKAKQMADTETALRQDYITVFKPFQAVADNYGALQSVRDSDTPLKDLVYTFSLMKMIEPTSAVLSGERIDVEKRGGIPAWIANLYNQVVDGDRLTPQQRAQIEQAADNLYKQRSNDYKQRGESIRQTAVRQGLNPDNVTIEFGVTKPAPPPKPQSPVESVVNQANAPAAAQTPPAAQTQAAPRKKTYQGREYIFDETQQVWVRQ